MIKMKCSFVTSMGIKKKSEFSTGFGPVSSLARYWLGALTTELRETPGELVHSYMKCILHTARMSEMFIHCQKKYL